MLINKYLHKNPLYKKTNFYEMYKKNVFSQNGEDGIIEKLINIFKIDASNELICEFGAADGIFYSNTFNLIKNYNTKALYIEGDNTYYNKLEELSKEYTSIIPHKEYVNNNLEEIFKMYDIDKDFLLLSIDIDGNDYNVWKSLINYHPRIVIIEVASGIIPPIKSIYDKNKGTCTSFMSMYELGISKGYELLCHTGNMIFIRNDLFKKYKFTKYNNIIEIFCPKHVKNPNDISKFIKYCKNI